MLRIVNAAVRATVEYDDLPRLAGRRQVLPQPFPLFFKIVFAVQNGKMRIQIIKRVIASFQRIDAILRMIEVRQEIIVFLRTGDFVVADDGYDRTVQ